MKAGCLVAVSTTLPHYQHVQLPTSVQYFQYTNRSRLNDISVYCPNPNHNPNPNMLVY